MNTNKTMAIWDDDCLSGAQIVHSRVYDPRETHQPSLDKQNQHILQPHHPKNISPPSSAIKPSLQPQLQKNAETSHRFSTERNEEWEELILRASKVKEVQADENLQLVVQKIVREFYEEYKIMPEVRINPKDPTDIILLGRFNAEEEKKAVPEGYTSYHLKPQFIAQTQQQTTVSPRPSFAKPYPATSVYPTVQQSSTPSFKGIDINPTTQRFTSQFGGHNVQTKREIVNTSTNGNIRHITQQIFPTTIQATAPTVYPGASSRKVNSLKPISIKSFIPTPHPSLSPPQSNYFQVRPQPQPQQQTQILPKPQTTQLQQFQSKPQFQFYNQPQPQQQQPLQSQPQLQPVSQPQPQSQPQQYKSKPQPNVQPSTLPLPLPPPPLTTTTTQVSSPKQHIIRLDREFNSNDEFKQFLKMKNSPSTESHSVLNPGHFLASPKVLVQDSRIERRQESSQTGWQLILGQARLSQPMKARKRLFLQSERVYKQQQIQTVDEGGCCSWF